MELINDWEDFTLTKLNITFDSLNNILVKHLENIMVVIIKINTFILKTIFIFDIILILYKLSSICGYVNFWWSLQILVKCFVAIFTEEVEGIGPF